MPDARNDARDAAQRSTAPLRETDPTTANGPIDLNGKTALVTGAASGIGAAIARALSRAGAKVHAVDRDEAGLAGVAQESGISPVVADLADLDGLAGLPTAVDILVNNAGIQHVSPVEE
ncbi:MAG TPA: SDR family NAD(P)-dependent oxidoreductase, partial [Intrasporangium sp.]|nr:SDR family NAD(P)-dependent oxidoreductase [Intrasporangium sp.]